MNQNNALFSNLKVVEFASVLAGPAVGLFFSELGARVIKIENKTTGGDVTRSWKQPGEDPHSPISAYWCAVNWGKEHLLLDLTDMEDRAKALELALSADIVISNFKPSFARKIGLDAETLRAENPGLIYAELHSFADPEDESPAFDIVLQAEAGFLYMCGEADRPPARMPVAFIDLAAAHQLKEGILIALLQRERTGRGAHVQTSLMESALASLANQASNYLMTGRIPQRMGAAHPNIAPYGDTFTCSDGKMILLSVGTERQFQALCTATGLTGLGLHPDFSTNTDRVKNRKALNEQLSRAFLQKSLDDWMTLLKQVSVPAARIRDMEAVFERPEAGKMILEENFQGIPTRRVQTVAFHITDGSIT